MQRCKKCIMPISYPGIEFDADGVCNFCTNHRKINYQGAEALRRRIVLIKKHDEKSAYDCAIGFSGGRDSSYLLYYLSQKMKMNVVAFAIDNGKIPMQTWDNIRKITKLLGVDLVVKKYPYLNACFRDHLKFWMHKPSAAMIPALCVGCRFGLEKGKYELLKKYRVPVYIVGGTPFEGNGYKTKLLSLSGKSKKKMSLLLGYTREIIKNRKWLSRPNAFVTQGKEFWAYYYRGYTKLLKKTGHQIIAPYRKYIKWDEKRVVTTIEKELGWQRNVQTGSTWRGDCDIALLKLYLYKVILGYNDKDDSLSDLIRDEQITRENAMQRLEREQYIMEESIQKILELNAIAYADFKNAIGIN